MWIVKLMHMLQVANITGEGQEREECPAGR